MSKKFTTTWFYASLGKYDVEKRGLIRKTKETHDSQRYPDFDDFAQRLENIYSEMDASGYDVINVVPTQMGQSEASIGKTKELISETNYLGDVGFSITRGAVVVGKKRES